MQIKSDRNAAIQHNAQLTSSGSALSGMNVSDVTGGNSNAIASDNALRALTVNMLNRYSSVLAHNANQISVLSEDLLKTDWITAQQIGK